MKRSDRCRLSAMRCPGCDQTWLVPGAGGDARPYLCKQCGGRLSPVGDKTTPDGPGDAHDGEPAAPGGPAAAGRRASSSRLPGSRAA